MFIGLACTGGTQYGGAPETTADKKKPAAGASTGAKDLKNGPGAKVDDEHHHDHPATEKTGNQTDASVTKAPAAPAPTPTVGATPATPQSTDPNVVIFTIPAGTGSRAWNSPSNPIQIRQGQTLVVKNDDSRMHWIHTNFTPFPHPFAGINPGGSAQYRINGTSAAGMRDHLTGAPIYMTISR